MLETSLSAACWPAERLHRHGYRESDLCGRCQLHSETLLHRYWCCPCNQHVEHASVAATAHLAQRAIAESSECPAFWLRGIPPTAAYPDLEPPDTVSCSVHGRFDALPAGVVFATDGSGGANTSDARLRRCGWSVCALSLAPCPDILAAAWGPLPGRQTVPRAELYALCVLLALRPAEALTVHIDCFPVYQGWKAGQEACMKGSAMDDLWWLFWGLLRPRPGALLLLWCPSHTTPASVAQGLLSKEAFLANAAADCLASRAAAAAQLSPDLVQRVREVDALVLAVQDRLVAINLAVAQELGPLRRTWRKRRKEEPAAQLAALRAATTHRLARQGRTVFCAVCLQSCQLALQARWLARGPCPGPPPAASGGAGRRKGCCPRPLRRGVGLGLSSPRSRRAPHSLAHALLPSGGLSLGCRALLALRGLVGRARQNSWPSLPARCA